MGRILSALAAGASVSTVQDETGTRPSSRGEKTEIVLQRTLSRCSGPLWPTAEASVSSVLRSFYTAALRGVSDATPQTAKR